MVVSDPCYAIGTWFQTEIENAKKGTWLAFVKKINDYEGWGERCAKLIVHHQNYDLPKEGWEHISSIGVDSGQVGIFDKESYRNDSLIKGTTGHKFATLDGPAGDRWYSACCDITLSRMHAGILEGGVVSESGYGDGSYNCYIKKNKDGEIIAVKLVFI